MRAVGGNTIDPFSVFHDVDDAGIHVADIHGIVRGDLDSAARGKRPALDEFTVLVEDGNALIVAVVYENPALRIQRDAVRELKLSGLGALHTADDSDELTVAREVHDA